MWKEYINVLIIEDDLDLLEMEHDLFIANGYKNIFLAKNSEEAESCLRERKIDICLSDVQYPTKNGVELMQEMKAKNLSPNFLIFTSGFNNYKPEDLHAVGACKYFSKPALFNEIFDFIDANFNKKNIKAS